MRRSGPTAEEQAAAPPALRPGTVSGRSPEFPFSRSRKARKVKTLLRTPAAASERLSRDSGGTGVFHLCTQAGAGRTSRLKHYENPGNLPSWLHATQIEGRAGTMSISTKIAHKAEAVKGGARRMAGRTTGSRRLRAESRPDQAKGDIKQAGATVKDASGR
jgi:uncharacterized protein YjbJ (UPF0337 family)